MILIYQRRDACLYGWLICTCNTVQKHQRNRQKENEICSVHKQEKSQDNRRRKEIQYYHNISFICPVRDNAADGRQQNGRNKSTGGDRSVKCR